MVGWAGRYVIFAGDPQFADIVDRKPWLFANGGGREGILPAATALIRVRIGSRAGDEASDPWIPHKT